MMARGMLRWRIFTIALLVMAFSQHATGSEEHPFAVASFRSRAKRVVDAYVRGVDARISRDADILVNLLRDPDPAVRFAVYWMCRGNANTDLDSFSGFSVAGAEPKLVLGQEAESIRQKLKDLIPTWPSVDAKRRARLTDRGDSICGMVMWYATCNNLRHYAGFGTPDEQRDISVLLIEIARLARGTDSYYMAAGESCRIWLGKKSWLDRHRKIGKIGIGPYSLNWDRANDEAVDRYLDWLWDMLQYSYWHPYERYFNIDEEAFRVGVPTAQYRKENPWGEDEGPNVLDATYSGTDSSLERLGITYRPDGNMLFRVSDLPPLPTSSAFLPRETFAGGADGTESSRRAGIAWLVIGAGAILAIGLAGAWLVIRRRQKAQQGSGS